MAKGIDNLSREEKNEIIRKIIEINKRKRAKYIEQKRRLNCIKIIEELLEEKDEIQKLISDNKFEEIDKSEFLIKLEWLLELINNLIKKTMDIVVMQNDVKKTEENEQ